MRFVSSLDEFEPRTGDFAEVASVGLVVRGRGFHSLPTATSLAKVGAGAERLALYPAAALAVRGFSVSPTSYPLVAAAVKA